MSTNGISSTYKRALVSNYGVLYHPNWDPTIDRKLGDYGTLRNGQFSRVGNLCDFKIEVVASRPRVQAHQTFSSGSGVSYTFDAGGSAQVATSAKAKLKVAFSGGQGISINAYGLHHTQILNYQVVAEAILQLYSARKWEPNWVVVMELYQAEKCVMAISSAGAKEAEIEFEAQQEAPVADMTIANANLGLVCKSQRNIGYTLDTQHGKVTLGIGLSMVHVSVIQKTRFKPFENKGRWGSDGPSTIFETSSGNRIHTPDELEVELPKFVPVQVRV